jgi:hypothetical protein
MLLAFLLGGKPMKTEQWWLIIGLAAIIFLGPSLLSHFKAV